jgi:orotate phosphoribosyltransferase
MATATERTAEILEETGALLSGRHIVYTSGRHGSAYVNKDAIYPHTERVAEVCRFLADLARGKAVDIVCGPATGGIILAQWTAHHLGVPAVYAEKTPEGGMALRRGYDRLVRGRRVLVVEDVVNTGGSLRDTIAAVRTAGGDVVLATALCNRGGIRAADVGAPDLEALLSRPLESWPADGCPLCAAQVPIDTDVGKGREFLARQAAR